VSTALFMSDRFDGHCTARTSDLRPMLFCVSKWSQMNCGIGKIPLSIHSILISSPIQASRAHSSPYATILSSSLILLDCSPTPSPPLSPTPPHLQPSPTPTPFPPHNPPPTPSSPPPSPESATTAPPPPPSNAPAPQAPTPKPTPHHHYLQPLSAIYLNPKICKPARPSCREVQRPMPRRQAAICANAAQRLCHFDLCAATGTAQASSWVGRGCAVGSGLRRGQIGASIGGGCGLGCFG